MPFVVKDRVRWSDCDPLGIIHYAAYLRFMEVAEHEFMRSLELPYDLLRVERGVWLPRKALHAEFHSPARMDEELSIAVSVGRVGTTSVTLAFEITRASDNARRASTTLTVVNVDKESLTKRDLPPWFRAKLESTRGAGKAEG